MAKGTCVVDSCEAIVRCRDLCQSHYNRWRQYGDPLGVAPRRTYLAPCDGCMTLFVASRLDDRIRWCSRKCRAVVSAQVEREARQAARSVSNCLWCETDITHMRADAKFCSDICSNRCDYRDNRDRIDAATKAYAAANPDKVIAAGRRYRERQREVIYARQRAWREANPDHHKGYQRSYQKRYAQEHPDKVRMHRSNRRYRMRANGQGSLTVTARDWHRMLTVYDRCCAYCGGGAGEKLHMEHVVPLARGGRHAIGNIVPACAKCNQSKNDRLLIEWRYGIPRRRLRDAARARADEPSGPQAGSAA